MILPLQVYNKVPIFHTDSLISHQNFKTTWLREDNPII
uniref:Uncharacterized protein n=1 Tax=Arundo donax TaxID=35708 RepID=A0A0A9A7Q2_ARUDO